ncbi:TnsA endonuclease N-terminal domain-containing protein [Bacillus sp. SD088]|uniref:TnsA endonuclease N-terminal domain-containing protein n=1 Tax=Bacillus sp. SD088 TaxID=2782012 RepID=UPI001A96C026|nr:TnsA endonuclease N-terminal domain-containing protein [Bacillus sp. SD088]MBO0992592.1 heteromeric transposase endonuclease subunit TnsA [Bacillus sp. SD088]
MAKRKRVNSDDKKLKNGRGQGIGINYKPWLNIQEVSSLGRSTRLKGNKIPRQYEFLSDLERNYFYLLEYSDSVVDIREQFPLLPIEETLLISDELGIKHPRDPKTQEPIVMTTDFVVTTKGQKNTDVARTIKYKNDLADERVLEKFEIERVYWERKGIDWGIVTENEISKTMATNIAFVHGYADLGYIDGFQEIEQSELDEFSIFLINKLLREEFSLREITQHLEESYGLTAGGGITLFKHLVITKAIEIDLSERLDVGQIIPIKTVRTDFSEKVKAI